ARSRARLLASLAGGPGATPTRSAGRRAGHRDGLSARCRSRGMDVAGRLAEDAGFRVFHFTTWAKARAMQHWIDRSGIAHRPMPKLGETPQEREERQREALAWGLETGAVHAVVAIIMDLPDHSEIQRYRGYA